MKKPTLKSKAVWGALLLAGGAVLTAAGGILTGNVSPYEALEQAWVPVSAALGIFGLRVALP